MSWHDDDYDDDDDEDDNEDDYDEPKRTGEGFALCDEMPSPWLPFRLGYCPEFAKLCIQARAAVAAYVYYSFRVRALSLALALSLTQSGWWCLCRTNTWRTWRDIYGSDIKLFEMRIDCERIARIIHNTYLSTASHVSHVFGWHSREQTL